MVFRACSVRMCANNPAQWGEYQSAINKVPRQRFVLVTRGAVAVVGNDRQRDIHLFAIAPHLQRHAFVRLGPLKRQSRQTHGFRDKGSCHRWPREIANAHQHVVQVQGFLCGGNRQDAVDAGSGRYREA